jgi:hypothetical protein
MGMTLRDAVLADMEREAEEYAIAERLRAMEETQSVARSRRSYAPAAAKGKSAAAKAKSAEKKGCGCGPSSAKSGDADRAPAKDRFRKRAPPVKAWARPRRAARHGEHRRERLPSPPPALSEPVAEAVLPRRVVPLAQAQAVDAAAEAVRGHKVINPAPNFTGDAGLRWSGARSDVSLVQIDALPDAGDGALYAMRRVA